MSKAIVILGVLILFWLPHYITAFSARNSQVTACERNNDGLRKPVFQFFTDAEETRREQAKLATGKERQINLTAAKAYKDDAQLMIDASEPDVLLDPKRPEVDCQEAFPRPFPVNLFT